MAINSVNAGFRVLVVDDNMMTINLVTSMLKKTGFEQIETASNGLDAWDKITASNAAGKLYDILVIDWNMPELSGYEVLRRCREEAVYDRMAIVMLTAENQKRNILEATKAGATSYIVKPVDADEFNNKMNQVFVWMNKNKGAA